MHTRTTCVGKTCTDTGSLAHPKHGLPGSKSKLLEALPILKAALEKDEYAFYTSGTGVSK